jgi:Uncharacterized protein conserved in bacteria
VFKWLTPNDKLDTYGLDDPEVEGVACHFTVPKRGGLQRPPCSPINPATKIEFFESKREWQFATFGERFATSHE